jgi:hypothetical protein
MSVSCPHCSKELEGFTTEAVLKQRLEGQGEKYKMREEELKQQLSTANTAAAKYKADAERLPEVERERDAMKAERELADAYAAAGIEPGEDVEKAKRISRYARNAHEDHKAEQGDKALSFVEFLKAEAEADPVLMAVRRKADQAPPPPAQGANGVKPPASPAPKVPAVPPRDPSLTGTPPQSGNGQTTIDQIKGMVIRTPQDKEAVQTRLREMMNGGT